MPGIPLHFSNVTPFSVRQTKSLPSILIFTKSFYQRKLCENTGKSQSVSAFLPGAPDPPTTAVPGAEY
jgi:hypothetical protein